MKASTRSRLGMRNSPLQDPRQRNVREARVPRIHRINSGIPARNLLAAEIFAQFKPAILQGLAKNLRIEPREKRLTQGRQSFLQREEIFRLRTQESLVNVGQYQLAARKRTARDRVQGGDIRRGSQVHGYAEPGEKGRLI